MTPCARRTEEWRPAGRGAAPQPEELSVSPAAGAAAGRYVHGWPAPVAPVALADTGAWAAFTDRRHGDARALLSSARAGDPTVRWKWANQVHGAQVVCVARDDPPGRDGDALVTGDDIGLAVFVADCVPVVLAGSAKCMAVAHCGWRGLVAGVLPAVAHTMRDAGATALVAAVGPCIGPECYAFGEADRAVVARAVEAVGGGRSGIADSVAGRTRSGSPALDLRAGVAAVLTGCGVDVVYEDHRCTACAKGGGDFFSARARNDAGRQAGLVWRA